MVKHASGQLDMVPYPIPYTSVGSPSLSVNNSKQNTSGLLIKVLAVGTLE